MSKTERATKKTKFMAAIKSGDRFFTNMGGEFVVHSICEQGVFMIVPGAAKEKLEAFYGKREIDFSLPALVKWADFGVGIFAVKSVHTDLDIPYEVKIK
jgi:hypothetical protein